MKERTATCPECSTERTTRATPRTRLRCRQCGASFLAPPTGPAMPDAGEDDAPTAATAPAATGGGTVTVVQAGQVELRPHPIAPTATDSAPTEPTPEADAPAPAPEPDPPRQTETAPAPAPPAPAEAPSVRERLASRRRPVRR